MKIILPGKLQRPAPAQVSPDPVPTTVEPVLLIHGTFANKKGDPPVDWWHPGSDFCTHVDGMLERAGSSARCWADLARPSPPSAPAALWCPPAAPFAWTGDNSEIARREGGRALATRLEALENATGVHRYHLIAHSHGGNVVLNALRELPTPPGKLGTVVFMGTPVLKFRHRLGLDARWVSVPLYLGLLGLAVHQLTRYPDAQLVIVLGITALVIALSLDLLRGPRRGLRDDDGLYGTGRAHAFVFEGEDEAVNGLLLAASAVAAPNRFIDQFLAPEAPTPAAFAPTPAPQRGLAEQLRESGAYAAIRELEDSTPALPDAAALRALASGATQPNFSLLPPTSPVRDVARVINTATAGLPYRSMLVLLLWICALAPVLLMTVVRVSYSMLSGTLSWVVRWLGLVVLIDLSRFVLPRLLQRVTFGADLGSYVGVSAYPPGVTVLEPVDEALRDEVNAVQAGLGGGAGVALLQTLAQRDALSLKVQIKEALRNRALVHSYYYRSPHVRDRIAALIARPAAVAPPVRWPAFGLLRQALGLPLVHDLHATGSSPPAGERVSQAQRSGPPGPPSSV